MLRAQTQVCPLCKEPMVFKHVARMQYLWDAGSIANTSTCWA